MRIATLGISHETNTFSRVPAEYDKFVEVELLRGEEIIERHGDSNYTIAGYLEASRELGFELVPLMFARTGPIGTITKDAYDRLSGEMLGMLRDQGPWDAVLIANHGATQHAICPTTHARTRGRWSPPDREWRFVWSRCPSRER